ncbi:MAG: cupin domain-containing protein [Pseudomonadota bacterium]
MNVGNLYSGIPKALPTERFDDLINTPGLRLERIVSRGHATPVGQWYDQDRAEWVVLLKGAAGLRFEGTADMINLKPGDYLHIPPHVRHRVEWTAAETETVWLALYF